MIYGGITLQPAHYEQAQAPASGMLALSYQGSFA